MSKASQAGCLAISILVAELQVGHPHESFKLREIGLTVKFVTPSR